MVFLGPGALAHALIHLVATILRIKSERLAAPPPDLGNDDDDDDETK